MNDKVTPIFIFSLPRSGSTLLQRLLMSSQEIASVAEPWILLPLIYMNRPKGVVSEYSHLGSYQALQDFISSLSGGEESYYEELQGFILKLYEKQCTGGEKYFLDKTPRYYLIIPEIIKIFPSAKFIFLYRNPVHILSSVIQTWGRGTMKSIHRYSIDIKYGMNLLTQGLSLLDENYFVLNYEKVVSHPDCQINELCNFLGIDYNPALLVNFSRQNTAGRFGDPTGVRDYDLIEKDSLLKWKHTLNTKTKVQFVISNINEIDDNSFVASGYSRMSLLDELQAHKRNLPFGVLDYVYIKLGFLILRFNLNIIFGKRIVSWRKGKLLS